MSGCVLVTGASGFVGRHVVAQLASQGWRVRAAARNTACMAPTPGVEAVPLGDLGGEVDWASLMSEVTHVVHLAAIAHRSRGIPAAVYARVNAEAAGEMARAAAAAGVRGLVFVSSVRAQSGPVRAEVLTEADTPAPTDDYGRSKLQGERLVAAAYGGAVILRPVVVYGPGMTGNMAALRQLAALPVPLPLARATAKRSVLSVGNLAAAITFVLAAPETAGQTFLVADPEPISLAGIVTAMRAGLGRRPWLVPAPTPLIARMGAFAGYGGLAAQLERGVTADVSRLLQAGWTPPERTESALGEVMRISA